MEKSRKPRCFHCNSARLNKHTNNDKEGYPGHRFVCLCCGRVFYNSKVTIAKEDFTNREENSVWYHE